LCYLNFLWRIQYFSILQLSAVTARGIVIATSLALQEHAEKVAAALTLRFLHCNYSQLLDKAIKATLMVRKTESRSPVLTDVDLFFQEVLHNQYF
jgi:nuclear pore complex protein Nup133